MWYFNIGAMMQNDKISVTLGVDGAVQWGISGTFCGFKK